MSSIKKKPLYIKLHFRAGQLNLFAHRDMCSEKVSKHFPGKAEVEHQSDFENLWTDVWRHTL